MAVESLKRLDYISSLMVVEVSVRREEAGVLRMPMRDLTANQLLKLGRLYGERR